MRGEKRDPERSLHIKRFIQNIKPETNNMGRERTSGKDQATTLLMVGWMESGKQHQRVVLAISSTGNALGRQG